VRIPDAFEDLNDVVLAECAVAGAALAERERIEHS